MTEARSSSTPGRDAAARAPWAATQIARATLRLGNMPGRGLISLFFRHGAKRRGGRMFKAVTDDGLSLDAWFSPAMEGAPRRLPVVMMHGWAEIKEFHLHRAYRLNAAGHDTVLFDHRGHGRSSRALTTFGVREKTDVARVIDEACGLGLIGGRVIVMGHSMGAATALLAAADDPRIAGVVAFAPFKDLPSAIDSFRRALAGWIDADRLQRGFSRAASEAGFVLGASSTLDAVSRIEAPVLLVEAEKDRVLPPNRHVQPLLAAMHAADRVEVVRVNGANHFTLTRRAWPGLDDKVLAFCASCG